MAHRTTLHRITRYLLVWYAAFLGVAVLSPVFQPMDLQAICSAASTPGTDAGEAGDTPPPAGHHHAVNCPLCLPLLAPPLARWPALPGALPLAAAPRPARDPVWVSTVPEHLPARGPPAAVLG